MDSTFSDTPLRSIKGIGPHKSSLFNKIGIKTVREALLYLPHRYEDRSRFCRLGEIREGNTETVRGRILSCALSRLRGRKFSVFEIVVGDGTGRLKARWFNQPYLQKSLWVGQDVLLWGEAKKDEYSDSCLVFESPEYETVAEDDNSPLHVNRIVPIYRLTEGITQKQMRKIMYGIVRKYSGKLSDPVPSGIIHKYGLPSLQDSIEALHFPAECDLELWNRGESIYHERLAFDEFFIFELGIAALRTYAEMRAGYSFRCEGKLLKKLQGGLPFELTAAQKSVLREIIKDMERPAAMRRLLQGDVGSGKTVVAFSAMLNVVECGFQAAFMAPTAILAEQHYRNMCGMGNKLGMKIALLTGSVKDKKLEMIASGEIPIVVGTHALLEDPVVFRKLGLVVIDEQHKIGVAQRERLREKGMNPDLLVMTATPIPRSLALTVYGDLDYSVIDEMPAGRRPVETMIFSPDQKKEIYGILEEEIKKGRQAYVVYPVIEDSRYGEMRTAVQGRKAFEKVFPAFRVGLLHGKMPTAKKDDVMNAFAKGKIDLLVSTTVIEVGLDVPNATVMLVIHAERFGLAQLHQLRGRVGRNGEISRCLLVSCGPCDKNALRRLGILTETNDGFRIAQEDLMLRGPGEAWGTVQAGMTGLRMGDPAKTLPLLESARKEAFLLHEADPGLCNHSLLKEAYSAFWAERITFVGTG